MTQGSQRPRLMFVIGMLPTKIGGLERFLRGLAVALDASGWDTIFCFDGGISDEFRAYFDRPYITLDRVDGQSGLGRAAAGQLKQKLRQYKPQVFVYAFHGAMRVFPWIAKLAGCRRIFYNDHSSRPFGMVPRPLALPKRIVARFLTWPLTGIISVSEFTKKTGTAFGITGAPNTVINNGIEIDPAGPEQGKLFREKWGLAPDPVVVTTVCWMVPVKGVDVLLEAARLLLPRYPGLRLLMVGGGENLEEYLERARKLEIDHAVLFTDIISSPVTAGVFAASDVYCQPSLWQESSGLAVMEAMSHAIPVVASRAGGMMESVVEGVTGLLVPPNDSPALAAALERLIADAALRRRMGEAGKERVSARYRLESTVERYVNVLLGKN